MPDNQAPNQKQPESQTIQNTSTVPVVQQQGGPGSSQGQKTAAAPLEESAASKTKRNVIISVVVLILVLAGSFYYWRSTFTEDTDDAQVDGDIYQISSRVPGQVTRVYVQDNKLVTKGDLLIEIDPKDAQVQLEQAQAALASAQAEYTQANVNVPITSVSTNTLLSNSSSDVRASQSTVTQARQQSAAAAARVDQAKANALKAAKDVERYTPLVEKDVISRQQYDAAIAQSTAANASVVEAENQLVAQQSGITQAQQKLESSRNQANEAAKNGPEQVQVQRARAAAALAQVKQAQAKVDQALLNLSYTRVVAPSSGIINKKNVEAGANLSAGQDLLTIVPLDGLWVTANFKETQLKQMHPLEEVTLTVDALGGKKFSGKITQIGGATGSKLSLFPPENATGNYVKVVQRIPVRIDFTNLAEENKDHLLRPGFSVTPDVHVK